MTEIPAGPLAVLQRMRAVRPQPSPDERCEMCGETIGEEHSHVVSITSRSLMCSCRACYLLFTQQDATLRYRSVPERYLTFPSLHLSATQWDDLQIPVGVAFFFHNSELDRTTAFYPSPAGATESELPLGAWPDLVASNPELATMLPDVEALLVRRSDEPDPVECYLVPIDACYQLVGRLRSLWRGFDGGRDARDALDAFFDDVRARSRPAKPAQRPPAQPDESR